MSDTILNRKSPVPLFLQIRQALLGEIRHWDDPAKKFPTDESLARRFGVSKMTVRKALDDLVAAGLLFRQRGSGTFVSEQAFVEQLSPGLDLTKSYLDQGEVMTAVVLGFQIRQATEAEADILGTKEVVALQRIRSVRGEPLALDERCIRSDIAAKAGITEETAGEDLVSRIKQACPLDRARWNLRAFAADQDLAVHLCLNQGEPVLERAMTYFTDENEAVLVGRTIHRGDIVSCSVEIPLG